MLQRLIQGVAPEWVFLKEATNKLTSGDGDAFPLRGCQKKETKETLKKKEHLEGKIKAIQAVQRCQQHAQANESFSV